MTRAAWCGAVAFALVAGGCQRDSHQELTEDLIAWTQELNRTLERIRDEPTAQAELPMLVALASRADAIRARLDSLPAPDAETDRDLEERYRKRVGAELELLQQHLLRLGSDEGIMKHLREPLDAMKLRPVPEA